MPRRLLAVALLPPAWLRTRVDSLRVAVGDDRLGDLPSHLTLIPPINVREEAVAPVRSLLRDAATAAEPFRLELGPADSFAPRTPTVHLRVAGDLERLSKLRGALLSSPLDRPDEHAFVPHVTLRASAEPGMIGGAIAAMSAAVGSWQVDRLYLLERRRRGDDAAWVPIVEEPFGGPDVVGRGGVELLIRSVGVEELDVDTTSMTPAAMLDHAVDPERLLSIAEEPGMIGRPVAVAAGRAGSTGAVLERICVEPDARSRGIGRQVLAHWSHVAQDRGADLIVARRGGIEELLLASGFATLGSWLARTSTEARGTAEWS